MKLILFDFDGVLVDTLPINFAINVKVAPELSLDEYKSFFEGNIYDAIAAGRKKAIPDFDDQFNSLTRELKVPSELQQLIKKLSSNYILTIVSSSSTSVIKKILGREDTLSFFKDVLGSDVHKSKVEKIRTLLNKYNTSTENAVFITDTLGDIKEAEACGVKSIAVTWGFHSKETLEKGAPFKIVDTAANLLKAIEEAL